MNPYTGEILALANYPTYDPNKRPQPGDDPMSRFDLGVSVPFEPGSIFKVVTLSAALETTNLTTGFADRDRRRRAETAGPRDSRIAPRLRHHHHAAGAGKSSNIGAILIGQRVGREKMYEYAQALRLRSRRRGCRCRRNRPECCGR